MKPLLILLLLLLCISTIAQQNSNGGIAFYLVKRSIPCYDTTLKKIIPFAVSLNDLEDTAFIKNEEIISYTFRNYREMQGSKNKAWVKEHSIQLSHNIEERIQNMRLSLFGCARQFALVCDGEIIYSGCINNVLSSWIPPMVVLHSVSKEVSLEFWENSYTPDPRENPKLFYLLKKSNRFIYQKSN